MRSSQNVPDTHLRLLGFGNHQYVVEQKEVSVLSLHPCLQLSVSVQKERPIRAGEEGLDQWAGLWAHRNQEALSGIQKHGAKFILQFKISNDQTDLS